MGRKEALEVMSVKEFKEALGSLRVCLGVWGVGGLGVRGSREFVGVWGFKGVC